MIAFMVIGILALVSVLWSVFFSETVKNIITYVYLGVPIIVGLFVSRTFRWVLIALAIGCFAIYITGCIMEIIRKNHYIFSYFFKRRTSISSSGTETYISVNTDIPSPRTEYYIAPDGSEELSSCRNGGGCPYSYCGSSCPSQPWNIGR